MRLDTFEARVADVSDPQTVTFGYRIRAMVEHKDETTVRWLLQVSIEAFGLNSWEWPYRVTKNYDDRTVGNPQTPSGLSAGSQWEPDEYLQTYNRNDVGVPRGIDSYHFTAKLVPDISVRPSPERKDMLRDLDLIPLGADIEPQG